MKEIRLFTIGFTKKSAEAFFSRLSKAGVKRILDIRLNNVSQLAGFAKRDDLRYFLKALCGIEYMHIPELAPTREILEHFKKEKGEWSVYERDFKALLVRRRPEEIWTEAYFDEACLLCSEDRPEQCHRRLVAEHLADKWKNVKIIHLV